MLHYSPSMNQTDTGCSEKELKTQVAENGSVMPARFSNTYKCTKIQSYLLVNCVKFPLNPISIYLISVLSSS